MEVKFCSVIVAESFQYATQNIASMRTTIANVFIAWLKSDTY